MEYVIDLREDHIKLGQALKASGIAGSGVDAKYLISEGKVKVNGNVETQRGKKLYARDKVEYKGDFILIR